MSNPLEQLVLARVVPVLDDYYRVRRIACGILALLIFDIFLTLQAEILYIWRRPWSLFKTLYVISRYVPIVMPCFLIAPPLNTPDYCLGISWYLFLGTTMLCVFPSDCLLALRLDRLYTSQATKKFLIATLTCEAIGYILLAVLNLARAKFTVVDVQTLSPFVTCFWDTFIPSKFLRASLGIPSVVVGGLFSWFAICAFYRHIYLKKTLITHRSLRESGAFAPIFIILVRDGVVYYLTNFMSVIVGLVLFCVYGDADSLMILIAPL